MASLSATAGWASDKIVHSSFNENQLVSSQLKKKNNNNKKGVELNWRIMTQDLQKVSQGDLEESESNITLPAPRKLDGDGSASQGKIGCFIDARR